MRTPSVTAQVCGIVVSCVVISALDACATQPKPQPVAASLCLPLKLYSPQEQKALAEQLKTIPADSPLAQAAIDYGRMRDADRACLASK